MRQSGDVSSQPETALYTIQAFLSGGKISSSISVSVFLSVIVVTFISPLSYPYSLPIGAMIAQLRDCYIIFFASRLLLNGFAYLSSRCLSSLFLSFFLSPSLILNTPILVDPHRLGLLGKHGTKLNTAH